MRAYEFLFEYNKSALISKYEAQLGDKLSKDHSTNAKNLSELLDQIDAPLKANNTLQILSPYMKWILDRYVRNDIRYYEDIESKVIPYLLNYDKLKRKKKLKPEHTDINRIKTNNDLMDIVDSYDATEVDVSSDKEIERKFYENKEATLIHNDNQVKVVVPHSERASCFFGRNTKWCTAATKGKNYFNQYNKKGHLYIVLIKKENKRFQFHFQSNSFMDEQDEDIDPDQLADLYTVLWDIFTPIAEKHKSIILNKNPTEEMKLAALKKNGLMLKYIKNPSEAVQLAAVKGNGFAIQYLKNPSEEMKLAAVKTNGWAIQYIENPSEEVQLAAVRQSVSSIRFIENPTEEMKLAAVKTNGWAIQYIENPSEEVQLAAVKGNSFAIHYLKNPSEAVQLAAVNQDGRAIQYIENPSEAAKRAAGVT